MWSGRKPKHVMENHLWIKIVKGLSFVKDWGNIMPKISIRPEKLAHMSVHSRDARPAPPGPSPGENGRPGRKYFQDCPTPPRHVPCIPGARFTLFACLNDNDLRWLIAAYWLQWSSQFWLMRNSFWKTFFQSIILIFYFDCWKTHFDRPFSKTFSLLFILILLLNFIFEGKNFF